MTFLYALRYFQIVRVVPTLFLSGFVVAVAAAAARLISDASTAVDALMPVLLLHLFATSSGFQVAARRGYYDLLLTSGAPRWQVAAAHWVASNAPGIASWICVGVLEQAASHGTHAASAAPGTCAAFVLVSLIAWAIATPMTRGTASIGWLLILTIPPLTRFASPVLLLGAPLHGLSTLALLSLIGLGIIPTAVALWRIMRGDAPLEGTQ